MKADHNETLCVNSAQLEASLAVLKASGGRQRFLRGSGQPITAEQLETAARILRTAEPSICNGVRAECPGFIHADRQEGPDHLVFDVGILPCTTYHIHLSGTEIPTAEG